MRTELTFLETLDLLANVCIYRETFDLQDSKDNYLISNITESAVLSKIDTLFRVINSIFTGKPYIVHYRTLNDVYKAFKSKPEFLVIAGVGIISLMLFIANIILNAQSNSSTESDLRVVSVSELWDQASENADNDINLITDFSWLEKIEQNSLNLKEIRIGESIDNVNTATVHEAVFYDETGLYAVAGGFILVAFIALLFIVKKPANRTIAGLASLLSIILAGSVIYLLAHAKAKAVTFSDMADFFGLREATAKKIILVTLAAFSLMIATTVTLPAVKAFFTKSFSTASKTKLSDTQVENAVTEATKIIDKARQNNPEEFNKLMQKTDKVVQKTTKLALAGAGK